MNEDLRAQKKQLRRATKARVEALPPEVRKAASDAIQRRVLSLPAYAAASSIFLYIAMPTEPDTRAILSRALSDGKRVYVPKCVSKTEMLAVRIRSEADLAPGAYGIPEPIDCTETTGPDALDLLIVPCVAASEDGKRLGHGAGYYDRFLTQSGCRTVCLCFAAALCDDIPTEPTDVRMHLVISE